MGNDRAVGMSLFTDDELRALVAAVRAHAVVPPIDVDGDAAKRTSDRVEKMRGVVEVSSHGCLAVNLSEGGFFAMPISTRLLSHDVSTVDSVFQTFKGRWAGYVHEIYETLTFMLRNWTWRVRVEFSVDVAGRMPGLFHACSLNDDVDMQQLERVCNKYGL